MADLPMAQIPNFQLGGPPATTANLGQGLAEGFATGTQLNQGQEKINLAQQEFQQKKMQEEMTNKLSQFGKLTDLYKNTHKTLRPKLWPVLATKSNELLGTKFDPNIMPESANDAIDAAHQEIQNLTEGKQSFGDTVKKMAMISTQITDEQKIAFDEARGYLEMTPEAQADKNKGQGSYSLQGYDPTTKQPIFGYSKAPVLVTGQGKPFNGPVQSKADMDKVTEEIRKIDTINYSVNDVEKLLSQIPAGGMGSLEKYATMMPGGKLIFQKAGQYQDQLPANAVALYRAWTGDTRLSDADAMSRAIPYMPLIDDKPEIRQSKIETIKMLLDKRKDSLNKGVFEVPFNPIGKPEQTQSTTDTSGVSASAQDVINKFSGKKR